MKKKNSYWQPYFWIIISGFLIYCQTLFFKFTYLDDNVLILNNYHFLKNIGNIFKTFKMEVFHILHASAAYYRPLLTISFILDAQLGKTTPFIYHLTNLNFHLLASCLLFLFLIKFKYKPSLALFFSLIFTVHPVLSQAVAWIPGRNDSLATIFILASFIFFLDFLAQKRWLFLASHLLFFSLAILTKEMAIFLPLIIILYYLIIAKKRASFNAQASFILGWLAIFLIWFLLRQSALENPIKYTPLDVLKTLFSNSPALFLYLGKIVFPVNLSVLPILVDSNLIYGFLSLVLIIFFLFRSKNKRFNFIIFGLVWFLIFLLPSFIRPNPKIVADFIEHRIYLPIIGFFIIILETDLIKNLDFNKKSVKIIAIFILFILSLVNVIHCRSFKDRLTFWQNAVKTSPHHPLAHRNLGAMNYLNGNLDTAEKEYQKALRLNPKEEMAHNNLGLIYMDKGLLEKAEKEYKAELKVNPDYDVVHFNLGLLRAKENKMKQAVEWWQKTIKLNPEYFPAYINLAIYFYQQKDFKQASFYARKVIKKGGRLPSSLFSSLKQYL